MRVAPETKIEDIVVGDHRKPHFITVVPTLGMVPIEFHIASSRLQSPVNAISAMLAVKGMEVGVARNYAINEILKADPCPEYIFFLGDDMLPPWDGLVKLYSAISTGEWDCLTGLYYWKGEPPTPLTWRKGKVGPLLPDIDFILGEIVQVDVTGMDFTLIRTEALRKMDPNEAYFKSGPGTALELEEYGEYVPKDKVIQWTEDVYFCGKAIRAGLRIGVHTGVRVAHLDVKTGAIW